MITQSVSGQTTAWTKPAFKIVVHIDIHTDTPGTPVLAMAAAA